MLGLLFEDDQTVGSDSVGGREKGPEQPPRVRPPCGLSGINNQGATCYLNSLIQTLVYTPEFRESLFGLGEEELGRLEDADKPEAKVRVIPVQLQRLFVRLLLLNIQAVSTEELTKSFGWTNNEQFQQHDVQELNRILFTAIESSLVGTSGKDIINKLYHGRLANKITCTECGYVSERQEEFMDIPLSVAGSTGVEDSLKAAYLEYEMMEGKNQYRCSKCDKLVDAKKGAKIRCLPSVLTLSLLRFAFNYQRLERYKETGKFSFPYVIDMKPYCDNPNEGESLEYELFSVVIHSGGAHGGHYHAYIRDIDQLGTWVAPEDEEIVISKSKDSFDVIQCDSPVQLVEFILSKGKDQGMSLDNISKEIQNQTGTSWKKRFKNRYGSMTKFLGNNSDKFIYHPAHNFVFLKHPNGTEGVISGSIDSFDTEGFDGESQSVEDKYAMGRQPKNPGKNAGDSRNMTKSKFIPPGCKDHWFDFNDSRVHPIHITDLEKQFAGRESAYMLFYRKKSMARPSKAEGDPYYNLPESLVNLVLNENIELDQQRQKYEDEINLMKIQIHFGDSYIQREGALKLMSSAGPPAFQELTIDRRKSTEDLFNKIREISPNSISQQPFQVNTMKELPAGYHLYQQIVESSQLPILQVDVTSHTKLLVWNGEKVQGQFIQTGAECEPVLLTVLFGEELEVTCNHGFQKSLTLEEVKIIIADLTNIPVKQLQLQRVVQDSETKPQDFSPSDNNLSVSELKLQDGDQLIAVDKLQKSSLNKESLSQHHSTISIVVVNRCLDTAAGDVFDFPVQKVTIEKDKTVAELKSLAMSMFGLENIDDGGRLRIDDQTLGLRHPLHEETSISESRISQGMLLVLEPGPAPASDEITLWFSRTDNKDSDCMELMVKRNSTVSQCLQFMLEKAQIQDCNWHLRKTNWCGEADKLLDDPDLTLDASLVNDGDHILLEPGRLPPKGFLRLTVMLHQEVQTPAKGPFSTDDSDLDFKGQVRKIKELYGWHFPELGILVKDDLTFIKVIKLMGSRSNAADTDFSEILSTEVEEKLKENVEYSMGVEMDEDKIAAIQSLCDKVLCLKERTDHPAVLDKDVIFKPVCPLCLGVVEISKEATLTDLKQQIMTLSSDLAIPSPEFMRLRVMEHGRLCNVLKNKDQILKRYKLQSNAYLALQLLTEEENLSDNQVILDIWEREPGTRQYKPPVELIWNTGAGTSAHSLKQVIGQKLHIPTENLAIAKHMFQRFEWSLIEEKQKQCNVKGKKKGGSNIRQAPYYIKDGDTIGVKNVLYDPDNLDDFGMLEDDIGKKYLAEEAERKRKDREERKKFAGEFGDLRKPPKPEVGITIQVGDFS